MNLYKIVNNHYSEKAEFTGIVEFKLAKNQDEIFHYIEKTYACWFDLDLDDSEIDEIYQNCIDEREGFDCYYGIDRYSWSVSRENITDDEIKVLKDCGILKEEQVDLIDNFCNDNKDKLPKCTIIA